MKREYRPAESPTAIEDLDEVFRPLVKALIESADAIAQSDSASTLIWPGIKFVGRPAPTKYEARVACTEIVSDVYIIELTWIPAGAHVDHRWHHKDGNVLNYTLDGATFEYDGGEATLCAPFFCYICDPKADPKDPRSWQLHARTAP